MTVGMTPAQQRLIEQAWRKVRSTTDRIRKAGEALKARGVTNPRADLAELDRLYQEAVDADRRAGEELEQAFRNAGFNV
jgi:CelD/BcsL family acetyltransferase involved in cellulose biosynthesis